MYNLLTPIDFPIDAKKMIHKINIKKGVNTSEPSTDTAAVTDAMISIKLNL